MPAAGRCEVRPDISHFPGDLGKTLPRFLLPTGLVPAPRSVKQFLALSRYSTDRHNNLGPRVGGCLSPGSGMLHPARSSEDPPV